MNRCRRRRAEPALSAVSARGRRAGESGASILEFLIAFSVAVFLIFAGVSFGLWWHCQHVVVAAAQEGLADARVEGGTPAAGEARATRLLNQLAPATLMERQVSATVEGDQVRVEVTGVVTEIVPGIRFSVRGVASGPAERFVAP